jgi:beta-galactosidase
LERERWPLILDRVRSLGFKMVETYIPWSVHETSPGVFDWGQADPRKDVEAFMRLCEERDMWLLVRPGPLINAELTDFGFLEWVLLDPQVQAHNALGTLHLDAATHLHPPHQFPVPSYASEKFYDYVGAWFDQVCPIIAGHLAPNGCVVAVQSDNETCYLFHDQTYATDYSPGSLSLYRTRQAGRYGNIDALNRVYGAEYDGFEQVQAPRDCEIQSRADLPRHLDWAEYKEYQIIYAVSRLAKMLRERGVVGVPIFHDVAYQQRTPLDVSRMEADPEIDWVGINCYRNKEEFAGAARLARYMVGSTRLPFVPELGCGIWSHRALTPEPQDHEIITLGLLMHGLKAFNLYMIAERERWQGSPITRHGDLRPEYAEFYSRLNAFLHGYRFWEFKRDRHLLVLRNYDLARFAASLETLAYAHTDLLGLPPELFRADVDLKLRWDALAEVDESRCDTWLGTLLIDLAEKSLDYDIADTHVDPARLANYRTVFMSAADFMDLGDQQRILEAISAGATVVVGPGMPYTDPTMQRPGILDRYLQAPGVAVIGRGRLIWAEQAELPKLTSWLAPTPEFRCSDPAIALTVWRNKGQALLFAANPTEQARTVCLTFEGKRALRSVWRSEETLTGSQSVEFDLQPYAVSIWEVEHD